MAKMHYLRLPDGLCINTDSPEHWKEGVKITKKEYDESRAGEARRVLSAAFPPSSTAYTIIRHVSKSGMSRRISVIGVVETTVNGKKAYEPVDYSFHVANLLGWRVDQDKGGVIVSGCGMDMGFHLVYSMSSRLYSGKSEVSAMKGRDGGYAVSQRWL